MFEDAYISFRFADRLVAGHGLVWNLGEGPVEGYTNFLWVLLCAAARFVGLPVPLFAQTLGALAGVVAITQTWRIARGPLRCDAVPALVACAFLAVAGPLACWATSGMETAAFACFATLGCGALLRWRVAPARATACAAAAYFLLAALTRPEGVLIFAVAASWSWLVAPPGGRRQLVWLVALFAAPGALYFAWRWSYFGYPLPNTFYAKTGGGARQWARGLGYAIYFAQCFLLPWLWLPVVAWWRSRRATSGRTPGDATAGPGLVVAVIAVWTLYVIAVGGDYMAMARFFVPVLPMFALLLAWLVARLRSDADAAPGLRRVFAILTVASLAGVLVQSTPAERYLYAKPWFNHGTWRGVQTARWHSARLGLIGRYFAVHKRSDRESLATGAIGAVSWFSGLEVYGFHGLVDPQVAHQPASVFSGGLPGHEKSGVGRALAKRPTFVLYSRQLLPRPETPADLPPRYARLLDAGYRIASAKLVDDANAEEGYLSFLEDARQRR